MKLQTAIKPRRDGTINVLGQDRQTYVFAADDDGLLTGDVADEATVAMLINTGNFWPASENDAQKALEIVKANQEPDEDGDEDEDDEPADAMPLEANTPPKARKPRARKAE
jgi:hypothetical protein